MHIDIVPNRKSRPAILLRESYREDGKVKKRTLANLSALDLDQAHKLRAVLQGADIAPTTLADAFDVLKTTPHGHVAAVLGTLDRLGIPALLGRGHSPERSTTLALIAGRILSPGSKLALSRHLTGHASTLAEDLELDPELTEQNLYAAMRWLLPRQDRIEKRLAGRHLGEGRTVLYDLSSSYYEGSCCELAKRGHNRDKKKGKLQINFGVLADARGCPVSVEVYSGNTSDPATVGDQLRKLRERFGIQRAIVVGDRGMLTSARLDAAAGDPDLDDYGWISALRSGQVKKLASAGDLQPELFDQQDLAEITSEHFPGERLVVCRNPHLAAERSRKRRELIAATEAVLKGISKAAAREQRPYHGKDKIARRVEREAAKYKMLKHFELTITEESLTWEKREEAIAEEAGLDGFYVVRARNVAPDEMGTAALVETYKSLSGVERVFRTMKTTSLEVRPIYHRDDDMVRAHIFLCLIAAHVQWHMEQDLRELLFAEEDLVAQKVARPSPVARTERSPEARRKASTKQTADGHPVHSFRTLLDDIAGLGRVTMAAKIPGSPTFTNHAKPTPLQRRAFELLGLTPPSVDSKTA